MARQRGRELRRRRFLSQLNSQAKGMSFAALSCVTPKRSSSTVFPELVQDRDAFLWGQVSVFDPRLSLRVSKFVHLS